MEKFCRFSMCNCLGLRMDKLASHIDGKRTYTAHQLSTDLFLKYAKPGVKIVLPNPGVYPKESPSTFIVPKTVETVLFSVFNDAFHPTYSFGNGDRYVIPRLLNGKTNVKYLNLLNKTKFKFGYYTESEYKKVCSILAEKINDFWPKSVKIMILYDTIFLKDKNLIYRFSLYNRIAKSVLKWPSLTINKSIDHKNLRKSFVDWAHYTENDYVDLYNRIVKIEKGQT